MASRSSLKRILKKLEIAYAAFDVLPRIERVGYAETASCRGHQLHQPLRAFVRNRERIVVAFHLDHGLHQLRIHIEILRSLFNSARTLGSSGNLPFASSPGFGVTTTRLTNRPVRESVRTTEIACGTSPDSLRASGDLFAPSKPAAIIVVKTAVRRTVSEQNPHPLVLSDYTRNSPLRKSVRF